MVLLKGLGYFLLTDYKFEYNNAYFYFKRILRISFMRVDRVAFFSLSLLENIELTSITNRYRLAQFSTVMVLIYFLD